MKIKCGCGAEYDDSAEKCPSCNQEMSPEEKAQAKADAAFAAASPPPGAPLMAARVNDPYICPLIKPDLTPHVGGTITGPGVPAVLIAGAPAAVVGDMVKGENCAPHPIAMGSPSVLICVRPEARLTSQTGHLGIIVMGAPTVTIGP